MDFVNALEINTQDYKQLLFFSFFLRMHISEPINVCYCYFDLYSTNIVHTMRIHTENVLSLNWRAEFPPRCLFVNNSDPLKDRARWFAANLGNLQCFHT